MSCREAWFNVFAVRIFVSGKGKTLKCLQGQPDAAACKDQERKGPQLCASTATAYAVPLEVAASTDFPCFLALLLRLHLPARCFSPGSRSFLIVKSSFVK